MKKPLMVLILEDQPADAELMLHELRRHGFDPESKVVDDEATYRAALEAPWDVILADFSLPQFDARRALRIVTERALDTPFIIVSGTIGEDVAVGAMRDGAADYLLKDRLARLGPAVEHAVQERQLRVEKRLANEALRESEEHFRTLVESAPDAIFIAADGQFAYVNVAALELLGAESKDQLLGKPVMDRVHPDFREVVRKRVHQVEAEGKPVPVREERLLRLDGSPVDIEGTAVPFSYQRRRGGLVFARDISGRKRAEQELVRLKRAVETSGEVVFMTDRDGVITFVNPAFTNLYGYAADEVVGRATPRVLKGGVLQPEDYERFWRTLLSERFVSGEWPNKAKDGRLIDIHASASAILDESGSVVGYLAIQRDIAERKTAEKALRDSEERYRMFFEVLPLGILITEEEGAVVAANPAALAMSGYSFEELSVRGAPALYADVEDRDKMLALLRQGGRVRDLEVRWRRLDGTTYLALFNGDWLEVEGRRMLFASLRDITEQRALEEQLRQSQKLEAVGQLAGGVAHDFNNLLGVILGQGEMAKRQLASDHPTQGRLDEILKACHRATDLTGQLLAFSRKQVMRPRPMDVNAAIEGTQNMLGRLIGEDIDIVSRLSPGLGTVMADPTQMDQVLMNLAVNARDAMPQGGTLTFETANVELDEERTGRHLVTAAGRYVMLAVSDTGIGMDDETRCHIFEPFFTTKPEGRGTGLGLAMVYGIVKQSGGFVWVYSEPGRGSAFKIYLPRLDAPPETEVEAIGSDHNPRGTETILVAEDQESLREIARETLEQQGYTVLVAADGGAALQLARLHEGPLHLLLTDVVMPGMSGRELAERLASERPGLRALFMSGYTDGTISDRGLLAAGVDLLEKPFTTTSLARAVRQALDQG